MTNSFKHFEFPPDFTLKNGKGEEVTFSKLLGKGPVIVYFYVKDDASVCVKEACAFKDLSTKFADAGAIVLGVSGDSVESHFAFIQKYNLNFQLLADEGDRLRTSWKIPQDQGYPGRVTFVFDKDGRLQYSVDGVMKSMEHAESALAEVFQVERFRGCEFNSKNPEDNLYKMVFAKDGEFVDILPAVFLETTYRYKGIRIFPPDRIEWLGFLWGMFFVNQRISNEGYYKIVMEARCEDGMNGVGVGLCLGKNVFSGMRSHCGYFPDSCFFCFNCVVCGKTYNRTNVFTNDKRHMFTMELDMNARNLYLLTDQNQADCYVVNIPESVCFAVNGRSQGQIFEIKSFMRSSSPSIDPSYSHTPFKWE